MILIESERLLLRKMEQSDFDSVAAMLRDARVMYAWEKTFSDDEIKAWIERRQQGYKNNGCDYLLAIDKQSGKSVGQMGVLREDIDGEQCFGIGWILAHDAWHCGYAVEGARACIDYAFNTLGATKVISDIRPQNTASVAVALRLGMSKTGSFVKHYNGIDMVHDIYVLEK